MDEQKVLEKIAYAYHEKFKSREQPDDGDRDWRCAVKTLIHLKRPINYSNYMWRMDEEDYGEFRRYLNDY